MSETVENRIVSMDFDNSKFEKNVRNTMLTMNRFKNAFSSAATGMVNGMDAIGNATQPIMVKFSAMQYAIQRVIQRVTDTVIDRTKNMIKSLTFIDQAIAGWNKYGEKTTGVQTIMAATGKSIDEVNESLEKLNWFTDETSYNFTDMITNIGKFTSQGIDLEDAVTAMEGISTWAAVSGQGTAEASRAMYNLSQAIGVGAVKLQDWKSIENANMATQEFKERAMEAAVAAGKLGHSVDELGNDILVLTDEDGELTDTVVSIQNFSQTLSEGWFTADVLTDVLKDYGSFADGLYEISDMLQEGVDKTTSSIIKDLESIGENTSDEDIMAMGYTKEAVSRLREMAAMEGSVAKKAFKAAQEAKTFEEAINSVKDAVSTGWMTTFEMIFGNYEEAKELWTDLANDLYEVFAESGNERNETLADWKKLVVGGRDDLISGMKGLFRIVTRIWDTVQDAFDEIFPKKTSEDLGRLVSGFKKLTENLVYFDEEAKEFKNTLNFDKTLGKIQNYLTGIFTIFKFVTKTVSEVIKQITGPLTKGTNTILDLHSKLGLKLAEIYEQIEENEGIERVIEGLAGAVKALFSAAKSTYKVVSTFFVTLFGKKTSDNIDKTKEGAFGVAWAIDKITSALSSFTAAVENIDFDTIVNSASEFAYNIRDKVTKAFEKLQSIGKTIKALWKDLRDAFLVYPIELAFALSDSWRSSNTVLGHFAAMLIDLTSIIADCFYSPYVKDDLNMLTDYIGEAGKVIKKFFVDAFGVSIEPVKALGIKVKDVLHSIVSTVDKYLLKHFGTTYTGLKDRLHGLVDTIISVKDKVLSVLETVESSFKNSTLFDTMDKIWKIIGFLHIGLIAAIRNIANLYGTISKNDQLLNSIMSVINWIKTTVGPVVNTVKTSLNSVFSILSNIWSTTAKYSNVMKPITTDIIAGVKAFIEVLATVFSYFTLTDERVDLLNRALNGLIAGLSLIARAFKTVMELLLKAVKSDIGKTVIGTIIDSLLKLFAVIGDGLVWLNETTSDGEKMESVFSKVGATIQKVSDVIKKGFNAIATVFGRVTKSTGNASTMFAKVKIVLANVGNETKNILTKFTVLRTLLDKVTAKMATANFSKFAEYLETFRKRIGDVINVIKGFAGVVGSKVTAAGKTIKNFFKMAMESIRNFSISDLKSWLMSAGTYMIDGLKAGISGAFHKVVNTVKDICLKIYSKICEFFGIHSPSTLMAEVGRYLMEGFVVGVKKYAAIVWNAITAWFGNAKQFISKKIEEFKPIVESWFASIENKISEYKDKALDKLGSAIAFIAEKFAELKDKFTKFTDTAKEFLTDNPLVNFFVSVKDHAVQFGNSIASVFSKVWGVIGPVVKNIVNSLTKAISEPKEFNEIIDMINLVLGAIIAFDLTRFTSNMSGIGESISDFIDNLNRWPQTKIIEAIGRSILEIAVAILIISSVPSDKVVAGMAVVTSAMVGIYTLLERTSGLKEAEMYAAAAVMSKLSISILVMAFAMSKLSKIKNIDVGIMAMGTIVASITGLLAAMNTFTNTAEAVSKLAALSGILKAFSVAMLITSVAVKVFGSAAKQFQTIDWAKTIPGLISFAALMGVLFVVTKFMDGNKSLLLVAFASSMLILASAMATMAIAMKLLQIVDLTKIWPQLLAFVGMMGLLFAAAKLLDASRIGVLIAFSVAMSLLGTSMLIFAVGMKSLEMVKLEKIWPQLLVLAGVMVAVAGAAKLLRGCEKVLLAFGLAVAFVGIGLIGIGAGLILLNTALAEFLGIVALASTSMGPFLTVLFGTIVTAVSGILVGIISAIAANLAMIGLILTEALGIALLLIGEALAGIAGILAINLPLYMELLDTLITWILEKLQEKLPVVLEMIDSTIRTLLDVFIEYAPSLIEIFQLLLTSILDLIVEYAPKLWEVVKQLVTDVRDLMIEYAPKMTDTLLTVADKLLDGINEAIPKVGKIVKTLIETIIDVAVEERPNIVRGLYDVLSRVFDAVIEKFPGLADKFFKMVDAVLNGITDAINGNKDALAESLTNLFEAVLEATFTLIVNLFKAGKKLLPKVKEIGEKIWESIPDGAKDKISTFVSDFKSYITTAINNVKTWISNPGAFMDKLKDIGKHIIDGIGTGIQNAVSSIIESITGVCSRMVDGVKEFFKIKSPSRLMMGIGEYIDEGLAIGITDNGFMPVDSMTTMTEDMYDVMSEAVSRIADIANSDMDLTPVISPIVDLTDVEDGIGTISSLFGKRQAIAVNSAIEETKLKNQNGNGLSAKATSAGTTYQFTQNNYSPKELSRADIYRQTRNQFAAMQRIVEGT